MASDRLAVIVGIDEYEDKEIKPLEGAVRDAQEVRDSLEGPGGGFKILHHLINSDATSEKIRRALYDLLWKSCDACELALFYFSGHGVQDGHHESYLAPWDVSCKELLVKGIKMLELKQILMGAKNRGSAVMILDCCHSGVMVTGGERDVTDAKPPLYAAMEGTQDRPDGDVKEPSPGSGKFILASAGANKKARERILPHRIRKEGEPDHCHGLFTFYLLEGLNGAAAKGGYDIYLTDLQEHISTQMAAYPDHEPYYWGFGKGLLQKIRLVTASRKQEIEVLFDTADAEINFGQPVNADNFGHLINGIGALSQALKGSPESSRGIELKQAATAKLQDYGRLASGCLSRNKYKQQWLTKFRTSCRKLEEAAADLSFERIVQDVESDREPLLVDLCRVALDDLPMPAFERELANVERPQPVVLSPMQGTTKDVPA